MIHLGEEKEVKQERERLQVCYTSGLPPARLYFELAFPHSSRDTLPTCMRAREGAEEPGVLVGAIVDFDDVVERGLEEGELPEDHCEEREQPSGRAAGGAALPSPRSWGISAAFVPGAWQR